MEDHISSLKDPNGIGQIKSILDDFGESIDLLKEEKET